MLEYFLTVGRWFCSTTGQRLPKSDPIHPLSHQGVATGFDFRFYTKTIFVRVRLLRKCSILISPFFKHNNITKRSRHPALYLVNAL